MLPGPGLDNITTELQSHIFFIFSIEAIEESSASGICKKASMFLSWTHL